MSEGDQQEAFEATEAEEEVSDQLFQEFIAKNRINMREVNEAAARKGDAASKYSDEELENLAILNAVSARSTAC